MSDSDQRRDQRKPRLRRTLLQRLRPFVRRDLSSRMTSSLATFLALVAVAWLGVSTLTGLDNEPARDVRVALGIEAQDAVCGETFGLPACTFDDREQAEIDAQWNRDASVRGAILHDVRLRVDGRLADLKTADKLLDTRSLAWTGTHAYGGDEELEDLLVTELNLRPFVPVAERREWRSAYERAGWAETDAETRALLHKERLVLAALLERIDRVQAREVDRTPLRRTVDRATTHALVFSAEAAEFDELGAWFVQAGHEDRASARLYSMLSTDRPIVAQAVLDRTNPVWHGGLEADTATVPYMDRLVAPAVRYRSPVSLWTQLHLFGVVLLGLGSLVLLVVSPVVTATTTAREREAGTLPVLRMTGLSAGDLALAMTVGPNVFALLTGTALVAVGTGLVVLQVGLAGVALPLLLLLVFTLSTNLVAIGLGDALGQRVNATVVGGVLGVALVLPGLVGAALTGFDVVGSGMLLGPLPTVAAVVAGLTGFPGVGLATGEEATALNGTLLTYALASQVLLGLICLNTWRRRVEQAWAPLFRPQEGIILGLILVGCSALSFLDLSARLETHTFAQLNLLALGSTLYLIPVVGGLLVASLRRPARARAVPSHIEARRAFLRFQALLALCVGAVGMAYWAVMGNAGLREQHFEIMWATLTQVLLVAETVVATFLWASRRRDGRARAVVIGSAIALLQSAFAVGVYFLEVAHVARENAPAMPFLVGMGVSPYWTAFLLLLWGAGVVLILVALMREPMEASAEDSEVEPEDDDDDYGMPGRRLIH